ncbi:MAG TPA: D-glycero-beta-D-manno-heptose 1-phosphate adenylyltransferase [Allocoleopsis sp.]
MQTTLSRLIDAFTGLNVVVIGDAILDSYLEGSTERLCQEAPVPVVALSNRKNIPGGAANTAVNIHSLGGQVTFLSVIGDDLEGKLLQQALEERGVSTEYILTQPQRQTLAKHRVIASGQMLVRFDQGSTYPIDSEAEQALIDSLTQFYSQCDAVVISDYGYGILTPRVMEAIANLQSSTPQLLVADSKNLAAYRHIGVTAVKPNYHEVMRLLNLPQRRDAISDGNTRADCITLYGEEILDITGAQIAAVTLDTEGAVIFERGSLPYRTYAQPTAHSRATGAGDTFISALTLALAVGATTSAAAELASAATAVIVAKEGTTACTAEELQAHLSRGDKYVTEVSLLSARLEFYRQQGRRIVFTNGCFDILHCGHITYLNRAKALGDILVIGVNSDESIRRIKGLSRPINTLSDRVQVLAALSCVDCIIAFDEDTPCNLIRAVRPDVFVKGGDYTCERLPEASIVQELGGVVEILPYLENRSTTSIIERIQQSYSQSNSINTQTWRREGTENFPLSPYLYVSASSSFNSSTNSAQGDKT